MCAADRFDSVEHCARFHQCFVEQYGQPSPVEFRLCASGMRERYVSAQPKLKSLLDAFWTDCKELDGCAYNICFLSHISARGSGLDHAERVRPVDGGVTDGQATIDGGVQDATGTDR